ncbi:MAG: hypothetical protein WCL04_10140 [Verrucomicrobiota bacterium]
MTNLGHFEASRVLGFALFALGEPAVVVAANVFLRRYGERRPMTKVVFWSGALVVVTTCTMGFRYWVGAQMFALPLLAILVFGQLAWWSRKLKDRFLWTIGVVGSGMLLLVSGWILVFMVMLAIGFQIGIVPPSRTEIIALVRQIGPERLLAEATAFNAQHTGGWEGGILAAREMSWPDSFKPLKPVLVRGYFSRGKDDPGNAEVLIFVLKEFDDEIIVEVIPDGSAAQRQVGRISPESPYGGWREKIAEGIYWYSTVGPD